MAIIQPVVKLQRRPDHPTRPVSEPLRIRPPLNTSSSTAASPSTSDSAISNSASATPNQPKSISARIADRFGGRIDPVLAAWWDDAIWQSGGGNEFRWPVPPEHWLGETMESIWPGLMPCHLLPVIGNDRGDYLCVRVGDDGYIGRIVHWYHGGGDWIPYGDSIAEAVTVDAYVHHLPGLPTQHADAADVLQPIDPSKNAWLVWAAKHLDLSGIEPHNCADQLPRRGVATLPLIAGRLVDAQKQSGGDGGAAEDDPNGDHGDLCDLIRRATEIAPSLAWTWDSAGRMAERSGNLSRATDAYTRAARCSAFTSQSVRLGTHDDEAATPKYSISRLQAIAPEVVRGDDYFRRLTFPDPAARARAIESFWHGVAAAVDDGSPQQVFALHMAAWDIGLDSMAAYERAIACVAESAQIGELHARAETARLHLATMRGRFCGNGTSGPDNHADEANIDKANIDEANIDEANIDEANINKANIDKANINDANINDANTNTP